HRFRKAELGMGHLNPVATNEVVQQLAERSHTHPVEDQQQDWMPAGDGADDFTEDIFDWQQGAGWTSIREPALKACDKRLLKRAETLVNLTQDFLICFAQS